MLRAYDTELLKADRRVFDQLSSDEMPRIEVDLEATVGQESHRSQGAIPSPRLSLSLSKAWLASGRFDTRLCYGVYLLCAMLPRCGAR